MNTVCTLVLSYFWLINFIIAGLVINVVQIILFCILKPFSKYIFRKINYYLCFTLFCHMEFLIYWICSSDIFVYIDKKDLEYFGKEHACIILNHRYETDWMFISIIAEKFHVLGNIKGYFKKSVQYLPTVGWCLYFSESVFLKRSFKEDETVIQKQLSVTLQTPDPIWMLLCPEGTRYKTSKHKESIALAQKKGLPLLKHHLLPKPKGFLTSLPELRKNIDAFYDTTIIVPPTNKPTLINLLLGKKQTSHIYIKRIPLEEVPEDEKEATEFLNNMFVRKDKLVDSFLNTGDYFLESGIARIEPFKLLKSYRVLSNVATWFFLTTVPLWYYLLQYLYVTTFSNMIFIILGFCVGFALIYFGIQINSVKTDKH